MSRGTANRGFTLIEILVVLIIVGLMASLAVLTLGGNSRQRELENTVRELYLLMQTAADQAVLNNQELGLAIDDDGYRFLAFEPLARTWKAEPERLFEARPLPEWMVVTPYIENDAPRLASGDDDQNSKNRPDIVFFSSGETTPFQLEFVARGNTDRVETIESDGVSGVHWRDDEGKTP